MRGGFSGWAEAARRCSTQPARSSESSPAAAAQQSRAGQEGTYGSRRASLGDVDGGVGWDGMAWDGMAWDGG